jgi:hypothetical protein
VKTNQEIKIRTDVNIGVANSEYSLWSLSNTSELRLWIANEFIFVNNGTKLVIISNTSGQWLKCRFTFSNREFRWNPCRKAVTGSPKLLNNQVIYTKFFTKETLNGLTQNFWCSAGLAHQPEAVPHSSLWQLLLPHSHFLTNQCRACQMWFRRICARKIGQMRRIGDLRWFAGVCVLGCRVCVSEEKLNTKFHPTYKI